MNGNAQNGPVRQPADHSWVMAAWVLPMLVAIGITILTAGFGAMFIVVAIMIGLAATALHFAGRNQ